MGKPKNNYSHNFKRFLPLVFILIAIIFGSAVLSKLMNAVAEPKKEPVKYTETSSTGSYVYVDIIQLCEEPPVILTSTVGVSTTKYNYYLAVDSEGFYTILLMSEKDTQQMKGPIENWNNENYDNTAFRVQGKVTVMDDELIQLLSEVFETTTDEIRWYFGDFYIDCSAQTDTAIFSVSAYLFIYITIGIIVFIVKLVKIKGEDERIAKLAKKAQSAKAETLQQHSEASDSPGL